MAALKQALREAADEGKKQEIQKQIQGKQIEFSLMMERQKRQGKK